MDINSIFGWDRGANREAAEYALQNDGQISLNPIQRLFGADESDVQNILDRKQQKNLTSQYGALGASAGLALPGADWGESESQYLARIKQGQTRQKQAEENRIEQRGIRADARSQANTMEVLGAQLGAQSEQNRLQLQSQENRLAHTDKQNRLGRGLERELAGNREDLNLQIALMQNDLAEKRMAYDRETRSLDRRDKMIAQLLSGLGQLGGAFAL